MTRRWRSSALVCLLFGLLVVAPQARATHCPPDHLPHPAGVPDDYPCPDTTTPKPAPETPKPTPAPTPAPTAAPTRAPAPPAAPVQRPASTPAPTAFDIEVPKEDPLATPEIIVDGPIEGDGTFNVEGAEETASASSWIFGFFVGLIVGALLGRASWGLRKRRRQQIFG